MGLTFLCARHRERLARQLPTAEITWDEWMESGAQAFKARQWRQALSYIGCSHELSEMLLEHCRDHHSGHSLRNIDRFMVSGHYLAECLRRCGEIALQRHYLLAVHHRLLRELDAAPDAREALKHNLEISLVMLERHFRAHRDVEQLARCRSEGIRALQPALH